MSEGVTYRFDGSLTEPIVDGGKTATVRVDDERNPEIGDTITAATPEGNEFAQLQVRGTARVLLCYALEVIDMHGADHGAGDMHELSDKLRNHYGQGASPSTNVHVVVFEVVRDA